MPAVLPEYVFVDVVAAVGEVFVLPDALAAGVADVLTDAVGEGDVLAVVVVPDELFLMPNHQ